MAVSIAMITMFDFREVCLDGHKKACSYMLNASAAPLIFLFILGGCWGELHGCIRLAYTLALVSVHASDSFNC